MANKVMSAGQLIIPATVSKRGGGYGDEQFRTWFRPRVCNNFAYNPYTIKDAIQ